MTTEARPRRRRRRPAQAGAEGLLRITEVARRIGVSPSALRLWEQQGLVAPARGAGRHRLYSVADVSRLRAIHRLRRVDGLNAPAIRRILGLDGPGSPPHAEAATSPVGPGRRPGPRPTDLGARLRSLRSRNGVTIRAAARRSGLSPSFISALERGLTGTSLATLKRLTAGYGATLADVLRDPALDGGRLVHADDRRVLEASDGIRIEDLAADPTQLEPQLFVLAPGASSDGAYAHHGEEFMFVLDGSIAVWLEDQEYYELGPGDALTFPSTLPHRFRALGQSETRLLWVNTPPTF